MLYRDQFDAYGRAYILQGEVYSETPIIGIPSIVGGQMILEETTINFLDREYRAQMGPAYLANGLSKYIQMYGSVIQSRDQWRYLYQTVMDAADVFDDNTINFETEIAFYGSFRGSGAGLKIDGAELWEFQNLRLSIRVTADIRPPPRSYIIGVFPKNPLALIDGAFYPWAKVNDLPLITSTFIYQLFFSGGEGVGDGEYVRQCDEGIDSTFYNKENGNYIYYEPIIEAWALLVIGNDEEEIAFVSYGTPTSDISLLNWESYSYEVGPVQARYWSRNSTNPLIDAN